MGCPHSNESVTIGYPFETETIEVYLKKGKR
jgi:hypothetical protein